MAYERKQFSGNAAATTLAAPIDADDLTVTVANGSNYPTGGANGKFVICIARGLPAEEKLLCTSRTGNTITVASRGHDSTPATSHAAGSAVEHVIDAETIDQANRLANLFTTKGDLIASNGTNPVRVGTGAVDADDDGQVLQTSFAAPTGMAWGLLVVLTVDENPPSPAGAVRLWYDETNEQLRPSDGSSWLTPVQLPAFASAAARNAYFAEAPGHACWRTDYDFAEVYDGAGWLPLGRPHFANTTARDTYYTELGGPFDGARAYITGTHDELLYRNNEWITLSIKQTLSASQPSSPQTGDVWYQPVS